MISIEIDVWLSKVAGDLTLSLAYYTQNIDEIIDWYTDRISSMAEFLQIQLFDVSFNESHETLIISYIRKPNCDEPVEMINEFLADPDDDGNHPLCIGNKKHIVSGKFLAMVEEEEE
jgi:hypothetical protein